MGQGDMLFLQPGTSDLVRAQGTFLSDAEIHRLVKHLKSTAKAYYHPELMQLNQVDAGNMEKDELFDEAVKIIIETKRGSVSLLQRRLTIGYSRASRLVDQMAAAGIVGEYKGSQAREVLITMDEYEQIREQMEREAAQGYQDLQEDKEESEVEASEPSTSQTRWLPPDACPRPKTSVGMAPGSTAVEEDVDEEEEVEDTDEDADEYEEEEEDEEVEEEYEEEDEEEEPVGGFVAGDEEEEI